MSASLTLLIKTLKVYINVILNILLQNMSLNIIKVSETTEKSHLNYVIFILIFQFS